MKLLKFYGASDDLFEMVGDLEEEIGCYDEGAAYLLRSPGGDGLIVFAQYAPNPTPGASWMLGVALIDEGVRLPDWPVRLITAPVSGYPDPRPYSPMLEIEAPDDVVVTILTNEK